MIAAGVYFMRNVRQSRESGSVCAQPGYRPAASGHKRLKASYVAPSEIELGFTDNRGGRYSLDEVMKLKEEAWFSKGVALAPLCNKHIVDASLEKLEELRQSGTQHQLIAVACSINHARDIRSLYAERGYSADIIHSNQEPDEQKKVLASSERLHLTFSL